MHTARRNRIAIWLVSDRERIFEQVQKLLDSRAGCRHTSLEHVQFMPSEILTPKAEATASRILEAALDLFRRQGFDSTTMRDIAREAEVATGGAYYYYPTKDAIVLEFYRRSCDAMQAGIENALTEAKTLEAGLSVLIQAKLNHFAPHRDVLRALLRNGADPSYPVSPFSAETKPIRNIDLQWFRRLVTSSNIRTPKDLRPHLPMVLWFFQMGVIFFWITDDSRNQERTGRLLPLACKIVATLIRLSSLPLMRPLRRPLVELIDIAIGAHA